MAFDSSASSAESSRRGTLVDGVWTWPSSSYVRCLEAFPKLTAKGGLRIAAASCYFAEDNKVDVLELMPNGDSFSLGTLPLHFPSQRISFARNEELVFRHNLIASAGDALRVWKDGKLCGIFGTPTEHSSLQTSSSALCGSFLALDWSFGSENLVTGCFDGRAFLWNLNCAQSPHQKESPSLLRRGKPSGTFVGSPAGAGRPVHHPRKIFRTESSSGNDAVRSQLQPVVDVLFSTEQVVVCAIGDGRVVVADLRAPPFVLYDLPPDEGNNTRLTSSASPYAFQVSRLKIRQRSSEMSLLHTCLDTNTIALYDCRRCTSVMGRGTGVNPVATKCPSPTEGSKANLVSADWLDGDDETQHRPTRVVTGQNLASYEGNEDGSLEVVDLLPAAAERSGPSSCYSYPLKHGHSISAMASVVASAPSQSKSSSDDWFGFFRSKPLTTSSRIVVLSVSTTSFVGSEDGRVSSQLDTVDATKGHSTSNSNFQDSNNSRLAAAPSRSERRSEAGSEGGSTKSVIIEGNEKEGLQRVRVFETPLERAYGTSPFRTSSLLDIGYSAKTLGTAEWFLNRKGDLYPQHCQFCEVQRQSSSLRVLRLAA